MARYRNTEKTIDSKEIKDESMKPVANIEIQNDETVMNPVLLEMQKADRSAAPSKEEPIVVHQDKNTAEKHAFLLIQGCAVGESPLSRRPTEEQLLIIATAGPIPSCVEILHGNVLVGSTNGLVLEFELNSEAEAKEEWKRLLSENPGSQGILEQFRANNPEDQVLDWFWAMHMHYYEANCVELKVKAGGHLPDLILPRIAIVDDVVLIAGRREGKSATGHLYAFDAFDKDFENGVYLIHNTSCHSSPVTALCGWRDPYCGDVRALDRVVEPGEAKAPYPYGRIVTASETGIIAVWALCCGERLAVWQGHSGSVLDVLTLPNSDVISCSIDGSVKIWALIGKREEGKNEAEEEKQKEDNREHKNSDVVSGASESPIPDSPGLDSSGATQESVASSEECAEMEDVEKVDELDETESSLCKIIVAIPKGVAVQVALPPPIFDSPPEDSSKVRKRAKVRKVGATDAVDSADADHLTADLSDNQKSDQDFANDLEAAPGNPHNFADTGAPVLTEEEKKLLPGADREPHVYSKDHFVFESVTLIMELRPPNYIGSIRCMRREGALLFCGGEGIAVVWHLPTGNLLRHHELASFYPGASRCDALVVAGGIMFLALVPQLAPELSVDHPPCNSGRIEAFNWETGQPLYSLYNGLWRPTGLSLRAPNVHDRKGERKQVLIAASFDDPMRKGRVMAWKFAVDQPAITPISSSTRERICAHCGKAALNGIKFQRCSRCASVWYCDRHCQENHWPNHRRLCRQFSIKK